MILALGGGLIDFYYDNIFSSIYDTPLAHHVREEERLNSHVIFSVCVMAKFWGPSEHLTG